MKKKIEENMKLILDSLFLIILFLSYISVYVFGLEHCGKALGYITSTYKWHLLLILASIFALYKNNKILHKISTIVILGLYLYSFTIVIAYAPSHQYTPGIGSILYFIGLFIILANMFVAYKDEVICENLAKEAHQEKLIKESIDITGRFILANYEGGLSYNVKMKSNLSALMLKENSKYMEVFIYSKAPIKIKIKLKDIKSIEIEEHTNLNREVKLTEGYKEKERNSVLIGMLNYFGAFIGSNNFLEKFDELTDSKSNKSYIIKLDYKDKLEGKDYSVFFISHMDPNEFVKLVLETKEKIC